MCLMVDKDYSESFSVTVNSDNTEGEIEKTYQEILLTLF